MVKTETAGIHFLGAVSEYRITNPQRNGDITQKLETTDTNKGNGQVVPVLKLIKYQAMKMYDLGTRWGEWSTSRPGRFTPGEMAPGTHWRGGWVGPRGSLDAGNRTPAVQSIATSTELFWFPIKKTIKRNG
jgi:hypothetical protein